MQCLVCWWSASAALRATKFRILNNYTECQKRQKLLHQGLGARHPPRKQVGSGGSQNEHPNQTPAPIYQQPTAKNGWQPPDVGLNTENLQSCCVLTIDKLWEGAVGGNAAVKPHPLSPDGFFTVPFMHSDGVQSIPLGPLTTMRNPLSRRRLTPVTMGCSPQPNEASVSSNCSS